MLEHILRGLQLAVDGGAREKLNSIWIPTLNIPQFAVPVWRITFAALTILTKEKIHSVYDAL